MNPPMTALVEREQIARIVDRDAFGDFAARCEAGMLWTGWPARREAALAKADAILALRQPGADYRRGVEDAATYLDARADKVDPPNAKRVPMVDQHTASVIRSSATAIRALSDSIPDTKGGRDGE